ncbi:PKD domain-containing protein [Catalinimonas sp. 4WD22]|uniref:PKD domain-containing protein n=1 Tax=Catalinimonas locisalis TaxID=3133978 RepID=UPI003100C984
MKHVWLLVILALIACEEAIEYPEVSASFDISKSEGGIYAGGGFAVVNLSSNATDIQWDFGDGTMSSDSISVHTYAKKGVYVLKLIASNQGNQDTSFLTIDVKDSVHKLLSGDSSKEWVLISHKDRKQSYEIDTCGCIYSQIFYNDGGHLWVNQSDLSPCNDEIECNKPYGPDGLKGNYEFIDRALDPTNQMWIGIGGGMGFTFELSEEALYLKRNIDLTELRYVPKLDD